MPAQVPLMEMAFRGGVTSDQSDEKARCRRHIFAEVPFTAGPARRVAKRRDWQVGTAIATSTIALNVPAKNGEVDELEVRYAGKRSPGNRADSQALAGRRRARATGGGEPRKG